MLLNESLNIDNKKRLSDVIHDILKEEKSIFVKKLLVKLNDHNIFINETILDKILSKWDRDKKYNKWLDYYSYQKRVDYKLKNRKPKLGKHRKKLIDKEKITKTSYTYPYNNRGVEIKIPIPDNIMEDIFLNSNEYVLRNIKKDLKKLIDEKKLENLYEPVWNYLINVYLKNNYYWLKLNKSKWKSYYEPKKNWKIIEKKDIDIHIRVLYYKYGYGKIQSVYNNIIYIIFDDMYENRFKLDTLIKNKSLRILDTYIKKDLLQDKNYKLVYLNELLYNNKYYHLNFGEVRLVNIVTDLTAEKKLTFKKSDNSTFTLNSYQFLTGNLIYKKVNDNDNNLIQKTDKENDNTQSYEYVEIIKHSDVKYNTRIINKKILKTIYYFINYDPHFDYYKFSTLSRSTSISMNFDTLKQEYYIVKDKKKN
jgi:hypothetical protein